ncbi:hypothetical protein [Salmonella enterica]|uniref:hypothetical protein n=1 Tax=Salmonella enterica TaxID=28901 RepID=UPI003296E2EF
MSAPTVPAADHPAISLYVAAIRSLDVTIRHQPLPTTTTATWQHDTKTLTLNTRASTAEHIEVMANLWLMAHGISGRTWARPQRRHLRLVR